MSIFTWLQAVAICVEQPHRSPPQHAQREHPRPQQCQLTLSIKSLHTILASDASLIKLCLILQPRMRPLMRRPILTQSCVGCSGRAGRAGRTLQCVHTHWSSTSAGRKTNCHNGNPKSITNATAVAWYRLVSQLSPSVAAGNQCQFTQCSSSCLNNTLCPPARSAVRSHN